MTAKKSVRMSNMDHLLCFSFYFGQEGKGLLCLKIICITASKLYHGVNACMCVCVFVSARVHAFTLAVADIMS